MPKRLRPPLSAKKRSWLYEFEAVVIVPFWAESQLKHDAGVDC